MSESEVSIRSERNAMFYKITTTKNVMTNRASRHGLRFCFKFIDFVFKKIVKPNL